MSAVTTPEVELGTHERLLASTGELIEAGSYGSVSVSAICEHAGVNKGSFYYYYPTKQALVLATIDAEWQVMVDQVLVPVLQGPLPIQEQVRQIFECLYDTQKSHQRTFGYATGCLFGSLAAETSTLEEPLRARLSEIFAEWVSFIRGALDGAVERGELARSLDAEATAWLLLAGLQGLLLLAKTADDPEIVQHAGNELIRIILEPEKSR